MTKGDIVYKASDVMPRVNYYMSNRPTFPS